jgi:hypothetical protein
MWNSKPKFAIRYFLIGNHNDLILHGELCPVDADY